MKNQHKKSQSWIWVQTCVCWVIDAVVHATITIIRVWILCTSVGIVVIKSNRKFDSKIKITRTSRSFRPKSNRSSSSNKKILSGSILSCWRSSTGSATRRSCCSSGRTFGPGRSIGESYRDETLVVSQWAPSTRKRCCCKSSGSWGTSQSLWFMHSCGDSSAFATLQPRCKVLCVKCIFAIWFSEWDDGMCPQCRNVFGFWDFFEKLHQLLSMLSSIYLSRSWSAELSHLFEMDDDESKRIARGMRRQNAVAGSTCQVCMLSFDSDKCIAKRFACSYMQC